MIFRSSIAGKRNSFLLSTAVGLWLTAGFAQPTLADGGTGGASNTFAGGAGGAGNNAAPGAQGVSNTAGGVNFVGSGGGGGAGGGGKGGDASPATGGVGGAGGTAISPNGVNGGFEAGGGGGFNGLGGNGGIGGNAFGVSDPGGANAAIDGGGGGGGGGGGSGTGLGGSGGAGGTGGTAFLNRTTNAANTTLNGTATGGSGGNGGDGGAGNVQAGAFTFNTNSTGGAGGRGGNGFDGTVIVTSSGAGGIANANAIGGNGGSGGRGGAGIFDTGSGIVVINTANSTGGAGGAGGDGGSSSATITGSGGTADSTSGKGGNGGAGGAGALFSGNSVTFTNVGNSVGGVGGNGGLEGPASARNNGAGTSSIARGGARGIGGAGGAGIVFGGSGSVLNNFGTVAGGNGASTSLTDAFAGLGGVGVSFSAVGGVIINTGTITGGNGGNTVFGPGAVGGVAVVGSGLTINNTGAISGGVQGNGGSQQTAIRLTGGSNFVGGSGTINGGIQLQSGSLMPALPGSTVGTALQVNGPVTFASGSTYAVRVNGPANDSIVATGVATVAGANVAATFAGNSLGRHTILTGSAISGTFASLSAQTNSAFLISALAYDPTHVYLDVTGNGANGGVDFTTVAQTQNQRSVAAGLTSAGLANGFSGPLLSFILNLDAASARAAFTSLDGEAATSAQRAAYQLMTQFMGVMIDPYADGRFGNGASPLNFAANGDALPEDIANAYAAFTKAPPQRNFEQRWSIWNTAFGGAGRTSGDPVVGSTDTRVGTFGYAGGLDYRFTPDLVVGVAAAGAGSNWDLANNLGRGRSEGAQFGAYSRLRIGNGYIAETIAVANHWFTTDRTALGGNLRGNFTGQSISGRIEGGYRIPVTPNFGLTPYAAVQAQAFRSGAYAETDINNLGFGLGFAARTSTDIRTEIGSRFDLPTLLGGTPFVVRGRLAWAHDAVSTPSLNATFQALPLSTFTVFGAPIPTNSALASIGADWYITQNWKLLAKFDGEFARRSDLFAGTISARYSW